MKCVRHQLQRLDNKLCDVAAHDADRKSSVCCLASTNKNNLDWFMSERRCKRQCAETIGVSMLHAEDVEINSSMPTHKLQGLKCSMWRAFCRLGRKHCMKLGEAYDKLVLKT